MYIINRITLNATTQSKARLLAGSRGKFQLRLPDWDTAPAQPLANISTCIKQEYAGGWWFVGQRHVYQRFAWACVTSWATGSKREDPFMFVPTAGWLTSIA